MERLKEDIVFSASLRDHLFTFHSTWGLFSPREIDAGSRLLVAQLEVAPAALCLDLGCGYGAIGLSLARLAPQGRVHLIDKDFVAVEYARKNAARNHLDNCRVYLSNAFDRVPEELRFDLIASNLPARVGNELLYLIFCEARARLRPGGRLWVVTIPGLKNLVKRNFREIFGNYKKVKQSRTHLVSLALRA